MMEGAVHGRSRSPPDTGSIAFWCIAVREGAFEPMIEIMRRSGFAPFQIFYV
jgi:hypothetical protein